MKYPIYTEFKTNAPSTIFIELYYMLYKKTNIISLHSSVTECFLKHGKRQYYSDPLQIRNKYSPWNTAKIGRICPHNTY